MKASLEGEYVTIESKGCILGRISSTHVGTAWNGRQSVIAIWRGTWGTARTMGQSSSHWDLHPSAKQIMVGDAICLFQGASSHSIIRYCGDHWAVILFVAFPPQVVYAGSRAAEWSRYLELTDGLHARSLRCIWNWTSEHISNQGDGRILQSRWDQIMETWNSALALGDSQDFEQSEGKYREMMEYFEKTSGKEAPSEFALDKSLLTNGVDMGMMNQRYDDTPLTWATS